MTDTNIRTGGQVFSEHDYVSVDGTTIQGSGVVTDPLRATPSEFEATASGNYPVGSPVKTALSGSGPFVTLASTAQAAFGLSTATVAGLAKTPGVDGEIVRVQGSDLLELTAAQWLAVTTPSAPLEVGKYYFLEGSVPGKITKVPPVPPGIDAPVGLAVAENKMLILLSLPVLLPAP